MWVELHKIKHNNQLFQKEAIVYLHYFVNIAFPQRAAVTVINKYHIILISQKTNLKSENVFKAE